MLGQVLALVLKELLAVLRDARSRTVLVGPPLIQLMVFGYAATFDLNHVPIAIYDEDLSQASRDLAARFSGSPTFTVVAVLKSGQPIELSDRLPPGSDGSRDRSPLHAQSADPSAGRFS